MTKRATTIDITVRGSNGAYVTNTVQGQRVSCTHSPQEAANRLGRMLFGDGFDRSVQVSGTTSIVTVWRLHGRVDRVGGSHVIL